MSTQMVRTHEREWRAVERRDASADGAFWFGVRTTGIYCKPSCAARRPRRCNVRFFASCDEAEAAGFRACRRCHPRIAGDFSPQIAAVERACWLIESSEAPPSLAELAASVGYSPFHFQRLFRLHTGVSPKSYAAGVRVKRLRASLSRGATITEAMSDAGFNSASGYHASANAALGMSATAWKSGGSGMRIEFALGACWLGSILVAVTERGVCAILLGDDPDLLARDLQDRFPNAEFVVGNARFEQYVAIVVGFVNDPAVGLELPLDIRGTAFQCRVWEALRRIPPGSTATYTEIARAIGAAKSIRAVAGACAANPLAVAIPCHRVLRRDGSLSGYRWGVERKRALLERERN